MNLKQSEIAESIGFNRAAWGNYETGASQPVIKDALKIAKYFGITLTQLIEVDISKEVGLIDQIVSAINTDESRAKSRGIGRAIDEKEAVSYQMNEEKAPYLLSEDVVNQRLKEKDDIIDALKGQIEALKLAISQTGQTL